MASFKPSVKFLMRSSSMIVLKRNSYNFSFTVQLTGVTNPYFGGTLSINVILLVWACYR